MRLVCKSLIGKGFLPLAFSLVLRYNSCMNCEKAAVVRVWFQGDVGAASIEYTKSFKGNDVTAHNRFLKDAQRKFPNWERIETEAV